MSASTGIMELVSVLIMWSGIGLPMGVPPQAEDPMMARIAPEQCVYYSTWAGMATPDPGSANHTEQLLAEKEIQAAVARVQQLLKQNLTKVGPRDGQALAEVLPELTKTLVTSGGAVYIESAEMGPEGPKISGAAVVKVGDRSKATVQNLISMFETVSKKKVEPSEEQDGFFRLATPPGAPTATIGAVGKYVIVGIGAGSIKRLQANAKTDPPAWLGEAMDKLKIKRRATFAYVDTQQIMAKMQGLVPPPVTAQVQQMGIAKIKSFSSVSGLDDAGYMSRSLLQFPPDAGGVLTLMDAPPLTKADVEHIPGDSYIAAAWRLDLDEVLALLNSSIPIELDDLERGLGIDPATATKAVGDLWTIHAAPSGGGILTGWTATCSIRNLTTVQDMNQRILATIADAGDDDVEVRESYVGDKTIYTLHVHDDEFLVSPSWAIVNDRLVVGPYPQAVRAMLSKPKAGKSLADVPPIAALLDSDNPPLMVSYQDTKALFQIAYPFAQIGLDAMSKQRDFRGLGIDGSILPSPAAVNDYLLPTIAAARRVPEGLEVLSHQTLPGNNIAATAPVLAGLLLPAIQSARNKARQIQSMNNMKMVLLAFHNYHDVYRGFPPKASTDADGKPLLSWRVHLLPYVEQHRLYDQFHLDEPWDSEHNKKLIAQMPPVYRSPNSTLPPHKGLTNYLAVVGKNTIWKEVQHRTRPKASFRDVLDGTANTGIIVEADDEAAVIWTKPDDYSVDEKNPVKSLGRLWNGSFVLGFGDGHVRLIKTTVDPKNLLRIFDPRDGEVVELIR